MLSQPSSSALDAERDIKLGALKQTTWQLQPPKAVSKADETKAEVKTEDGGETKKEEAPMTVVGASRKMINWTSMLLVFYTSLVIS